MADLPERLRRASWRDPAVLTATGLALIATIGAVIAFFPRSGTRGPAFSVRWPGRAARVLGPLATLPAWPGADLLLSGERFTGDTASVTIGGAPAGSLRAGGGRISGRVRVPSILASGWHRFVVTDDGTGQEVGPLRAVVVVRGPTPAVWAGPSPLHGHAMLVVGAGFVPGEAVSVTLGADAPSGVAVGSTHARGDGRFQLLAGLPPSAPAGRQTVLAFGDPAHQARTTIVIAR
jgi:hypothetical protein